MATAGVSIASAVEEGEGTSAAAETEVDIIPQPIVDVAERRYAAAAAVVACMLQQRVGAPLMGRLTPQRRVGAPLTPEAADRTVAAHRTVAANTTSRWLQELAMNGTRSGGAQQLRRFAVSAVSHLKRVLCLRRRGHGTRSNDSRNLAITFIPPFPPTPPSAAPGCSCAPA
jgi:hypothetical protein